MGDSTVTQISELPDLEDRIDVLEVLIQDLSRPKINKAELEILMNQYSILEESIVSGIELLSRSIKSVQDKKQLDVSSDKFNKINSDFQENWNDEYWRCYEMVKEGKDKKVKSFKADLNVRVAHLQELATTLNKNITEPTKEENTPTLEEKTPEPMEIQKTLRSDPIDKKCCNCMII
ncbi:hypothetical protein SteCoe_24120 [Stentor coeruleus]|uniref:Uncharacterized protein n=1 Tax=Stentor coeruleus TaxID=5963 RepID=A0A1R2BIB7_9CILI|nr:hypothetical protein SteCoe_24120 [Stentor coeruleus]